MQATSSLPVSSTTDLPERPQHQLSEPSHTRATSEEECLLCGEPVDIRLMPCGHIIICKECSQRAKKCPQCKVSISMGEREHFNPTPTFQASFLTLYLFDYNYVGLLLV